MTLAVSREEVVTLIRAQDPGKFDDKGLFFGINNNGMTHTGERIEGQALLSVLNEEDWKLAIATLGPIGIAPPKQEIRQVAPDSVEGQKARDARWWEQPEKVRLNARNPMAWQNSANESGNAKFL